MDNLKILVLVEGSSDEIFFGAMFESIIPGAEIRTNTHPEKNGHTHRSKGALLNHTSEYVGLLSEGSIASILFLIDADDARNGSGYQRTLTQFSEKFKVDGYTPDTLTIKKEFLHIFTHPNLPSIALWIMPDNDTDGVFEDWIKTCAVQENELTLAGTTVASLNPPKFKPHNAIKAEIYTWLAWQEKPALSLEYAWRNNLIDKTSAPFQIFEQQLKQFIQRLEQETTEA